MRASKSSDRWLQEHFSDPYVQRAQAEGWRSRAVFKLEEIDQRERLLQPGQVVLDLGAAPGAWSQYARGRVGPKGRVIASDILPMDAAGRGGVRAGRLPRGSRSCGQLRALRRSAAVDVLLSDMAPNLSGMDAIDQPRAMYLAELALDMAGRRLETAAAAP